MENVKAIIILSEYVGDKIKQIEEKKKEHLEPYALVTISEEKDKALGAVEYAFAMDIIGQYTKSTFDDAILKSFLSLLKLQNGAGG